MNGIANLLGVLLALSSLPTQDEDVGERIEAYLEPLADAGHLSGTLLVARDDVVLFEESFGLASAEHGVPNTPETRFCIASITKPMTLLVGLQLLQEGQLAVDDTLDRWIPDFPAADRITVDHLVNHRAGIPHRVTSAEQEGVPRNAAEMVALARDAELLFEPGARSVYSSAGFSVLARVLELVDGRSYERLLEERVFGPLDMDRSLHCDSFAVVEGRAAGYFLAPSGLRNAALKDFSFLVGAGSVWSTPADLFKLQQAIVGGDLGPLARANLMRDGGLRWNGATGGFRAFADYVDDSGVAVILTANLVTGANDLLRRDIPRIVAGDEVAPPEVPDPELVTVSEEVLRRYEGTYELREGSFLDVRVHGAVLLANEYGLLPTSETTFYSPQDYSTVTMVLDEAGLPERMDWGSLEVPRVGPRVSDLGD